MKNNLRILHLEDEVSMSELVKSMLESEGISLDLERVETETDFVRSLETNDYDLILADYELPAYDGISALIFAHHKRPEIPFILFSGAIGEELAIKCLRQGATDYVLKQHVTKLPSAVKRAIDESVKRKKYQDAQRAIQESEEKFRSISSAAIDAVIMMDDRGKISYWNRAAEKMFGYQFEEVHKKDLHQLIVPVKFRDPAVKGMEEYFKNGTGGAVGKVVELRGLRKDGSEFPLELSLSPLHLREKWHAVGIIRDITNRKKIEEDLKAEKQLIQTFMDNIPDAIFFKDRQGKFLRVNNAQATRLGLKDPAGAIGKSDFDFFDQNAADISFRNEQKVMQSRETFYSEREKIYPDGHTRWNASTILPLPDGDGGISGVFGLSVDITERKQAEFQLKKEKERAQTYLDIAGVMIVALNAEGRVILVNKKGQKILGLPETEIVNKDWFNNFVPPRNQARVKESFKKIIDGKIGKVEYFENKILTSGGEERLIAWHNTILTDDEGNIIGTLSSGDDITDHRRAEKALASNEKKYRTLIETMLDGVGISDFRENLIYVNRAFAEVLGYSRAELTGKNLRELISKNDFDKISKESAKRRQKKSSFYEIEMQTKDGNSKYFRVSASLYLDENDKPAGTIAVLHDITERRAIMQELAQEKYLLDILMNNSTDYIYFKDSTGRFIRVNQAFAHKMGFDLPEEVIGKRTEEVFGKEYSGLAREDEKRIIETRKPLQREESEVCADGQLCWASTIKVPMCDSKKNVAGTLGISRDITESKLKQEQISRIFQETEELLSAVNFILIGIDDQDRITRWNNVAEKVFGLPGEQVLRKPFLESGIQWNWQEISLRLANTREQKQKSEWRDIHYKKPDGMEGTLNLIIYPRMNREKEFSSFLLLASEVTEQRLMEVQMNQAQKLESIGQLAAGIAHEINTPTQFVGDNLQFLKDAFGDIRDLTEKYDELLGKIGENGQLDAVVEEVKELKEEIDLDYLVEEIPHATGQALEGVQRVTQIVRAMKEFSHPGGSEKAPNDLNKALENTITVSRNEWKYVAEVETDLDENLPMVPCLLDELNQVFLNIIVNAAHAIKDVVGDTGEKGKIRVETRARGTHALIRISDTGKGIPVEIQNKIFDPFFTTKEVGKGTGQGLAISYDVVVNKHGGHLKVESESGAGATFLVELPMEETN